MTTGAVVQAIAPSEIHPTIVAKCRVLGVPDTKFLGPPDTSNLELNQLFVNTSMAPKAIVHHITTLETIEKLNKL
jgi:hypothetical protein